MYIQKLIYLDSQNMYTHKLVSLQIHTGISNILTDLTWFWVYICVWICIWLGALVHQNVCLCACFAKHFCWKEAFHFKWEVLFALTLFLYQTESSSVLFVLFCCVVCLFISGLTTPSAWLRWIYNKHLGCSAIQGCLGVLGMSWKKSMVRYFSTSFLFGNFLFFYQWHMKITESTWTFFVLLM